jgi:hypothetical protein
MRQAGCVVARFYRAIGVGTFHHGTDLRTTGIAPRRPGGQYNPSSVMQHIARGATNSPCISLTKSYGVAEDYALNGSRAIPTISNPAYVYEIDIPDPPPLPLLVIDPIHFIASHQNPLASPSYHHDGNQNFLLGVVNPTAANPSASSVVFPPGLGGATRPPNLTVELEAMVYALRDAEVLLVGNLPQACVINRYDVY